MEKRHSIVTRGLIGGAVAATVLVIWFLVIDGVNGQPLRTPAFLASVLLGGESTAVSFPRIALFTVLHYAAFMGVGVAACWILHRFPTVPGTLVGAILGFLLFDLLFYGGVWVTGTDVVGYLGWAEVLTGNVVAGVLMVGALGLLGPSRTPSWAILVARNDVLREGVITGLIGAAGVAAWYLVVDVIGGHALRTPGTLGSIVFHGASSTAEIQVSLATVLGYTAIHLASFLAAGLIAAALAASAGENEVVILGAALLFVTFETFFVGVLAIIAAWLLAVIPWWTFAVANLIAAGSMGWYLWRRHPALKESLSKPQMQSEPREPDAVGPAARSV